MLLPDYYRIIADVDTTAPSPLQDLDGSDIEYVKHKSLNALVGISQYKATILGTPVADS